ncbi:MAG: hypothetical protein KGL98_09845 [Gammaproteobacteria bacterium]|nr:hypothetical protein [Gammaproteobacteria bacterium]MBU6509072.1 hypothetical protein [Gammaproteobacteria bacterium]MDE1983365.1 hypothetical protein [Gammaproteobacteria bacterium]MDE2108197.1 hypothetical protein [Gammaproteobacteria bacterium]MDE2461540.1 hypothetical protein [Gammaproteobacteria bacterium]
MRVELTEVHWTDAPQELSLHEFMQRSGLSESELRQLVEAGVLAPLDPETPAWTFGSDCLPLARTAVRLHRDLDLDASGLAVVLTLIERIRELEARLRDLDARLPHEFASF